jgi:hypothetical protein
MNKDIKNYGIYPKDEDKFKGEYLVILGNKILAHNYDCKKILSILRKYRRKAVLTKVPTSGWKEAMVL